MGFRKIDRGKLRRLCANVELSDVDIARLFGVTREAIRGARNRLGIKGRGRARVALIAQRRRELKKKLHCREFFENRQALRRIRANATKLGIDFELLPNPHGRHMRIANAICHLIKGQFVEKASRCRAPRVYATFQRPTTKDPFHILIAELPRGWIIVPSDKLPKKSTMFVVNREKKNTGPAHRRLDWANYYYPDLSWLRAFPKNETLVQAGSASGTEHKPAATH
jgi:hypothetical protein